MNTLIALGALKVYLKWSAGWCTETVAQSGKTALIAGASKHPGYEIAENLAGRDCRIIIADNDKLDSTRDKIIESTGNPKVEYKYVDFYKLQSVRKLAQDLIQNEPRLDTLIFTHHVSGLDKKPTEDGYLKVVQYNHLAPFLLTHELTDLLKKTHNSRVIFRSNILSYMHKIYSPADINRSPTNRSQLLHDFFEYCNSSALTLMTMMCFAEMLEEQRVYCCAVHPGFMNMTLFDISKDIEWNKKDAISSIIFGKAIPSFLKFFGKNHLEGAQTSIYAAVTPEEREINGKFLADCRMIMQPPSAQMRLFRTKIFDETKRMVMASSSMSKPPTSMMPPVKKVEEPPIAVPDLGQAPTSPARSPSAEPIGANMSQTVEKSCPTMVQHDAPAKS